MFNINYDSKIHEYGYIFKSLFDSLHVELYIYSNIDAADMKQMTRMRTNDIGRDYAIVGKRPGGPMRTTVFPLILGVAAGLSSCHLEDSARCDDGMTFDGTSCLAPDSDTGIPADAGADGGSFTGMMEPCEDASDCAEFQATYCLTVMPDSNICLIQGCSTAPNDCPSPHLCCDLLPDLETSFGLPDSLCMPPDYWETYSTYCVNG